MNAGTRTLLALSLIVITAAAQGGPPDTECEAEIEALEELYQAAEAQQFNEGEALGNLEAGAEAFIEEQSDTVSAATLATARTYLLRCRLSAEAYEEVYAEATALLETDGLGAEDRIRLLYYRGIGAVATNRRRPAVDCVKALRSLRPSSAASLQTQIARKWTAVKPGEAPPAWRLPYLPSDDQQGDKKVLSLSDLRGKYVLLDFWATWCGPCRGLMKNELAPLHEKWADDDRFVLVSIGTNRRKETAQRQAKYVQKSGYRWTMVHDGDGRVTGAYGVKGIPTLTFIGPDGKVIAHGYRNTVMPKVKETLTRIREADATS